ncbi:antibiotic biosynthesis monooxygenase [Mesorhizobium plurifarium]|uniref:putative quinol monooxygenase n=1 Tax=Sinorhizobium arboris TaxID=76745 RepID=UPI000483B452|nr:putative quinol monooxygenase [Sinorhizobium arboris]PST22538.1 antibiotic biosynthesis monooxygenase [Mesorhizobium plurifarium]
MVYIIAYLTAHAGKGDEVVALTKPLIDATRSEAGCVSYELYRKPADPDALVFVETWKDRAAIDSHFAEPHLKAFQAAAASLLASARVEIVHPEKIEVV